MIKYGTSDDMYWRSDYMEARLVVTRGEQKITCRISREALSDHYGAPKTEEECFDVSRMHFDNITDIWGHMIAIGQFEPDGSVLIKTENL